LIILALRLTAPSAIGLEKTWMHGPLWNVRYKPWTQHKNPPVVTTDGKLQRHAAEALKHEQTSGIPQSQGTRGKAWCRTKRGNAKAFNALGSPKK